MKVIIWNTDTFERCQKYEKMLHQAVYADFVGSISSEILSELNDIYNEVHRTTGDIKGNCSGCVITALQRLGIKYFNEKSNRKIKDTKDGRVKEAKREIVKEEPKQEAKEPDKTKPKNKGGRPKGSKNKYQGNPNFKGKAKAKGSQS